MKVNIVSCASITQCPKLDLRATHYRPDGSCKCRRKKRSKKK